VARAHVQGAEKRREAALTAWWLGTRAAAQKCMTAAAHGSRRGARRRFRSMRFLLVDDDDIDALNFVRAMRKNGLEDAVHRATDGVQALELLRSGAVPAREVVVVLDLGMPRMNGLEFLEQLRSDAALASTLVVVLSAAPERRDRDHAYHHNIAGFLRKPESGEAYLQLTRALHDYWSRVELP
jgi:CheY-like chemotaxis protein